MKKNSTIKVGIITFQRADNYGAMLQCYALYRVLKDYGLNVEVVDYRNKYIERCYTGVPNIRKNIFLWGSSCLKRLVNYSSIKAKHNTFDEMRKMIRFSKPYTYKEIKKYGLSYDLIICGSDQIWNPDITNGLDDIYFLNFPGDFRKCAYAVSLGNINQSLYRTEAFVNKINSIPFLSLREDNACEFIGKLVDINVQCCLDPALLLQSEAWHGLTTNIKFSVLSEYILLYYLDENDDLLKIAKYISEKLNIPIVCCNKESGNDNRINWVKNIGPLEFVKLIENATVVVTSSFHATAFSAMFEKNIHIIPHPKTGDRVKSLATIFEINSRIYRNFNDFKDKYDIMDEINYNKDSYLKCINNSKRFLFNAIENLNTYL